MKDKKGRSDAMLVILAIAIIGLILWGTGAVKLQASDNGVGSPSGDSSSSKETIIVDRGTAYTVKALPVTKEFVATTSVTSDMIYSVNGAPVTEVASATGFSAAFGDDYCMIVNASQYQSKKLCGTVSKNPQNDKVALLLMANSTVRALNPDDGDSNGPSNELAVGANEEQTFDFRITGPSQSGKRGTVTCFDFDGADLTEIRSSLPKATAPASHTLYNATFTKTQCFDTGDNVDLSKKDFSVTIKSGSSDPGSDVYARMYNQNYFIGKDGSIKLGFDNDDNSYIGDTAQAFTLYLS